MSDNYKVRPAQQTSGVLAFPPAFRGGKTMDTNPPQTTSKKAPPMANPQGIYYFYLLPGLCYALVNNLSVISIIIFIIK